MARESPKDRKRERKITTLNSRHPVPEKRTRCKWCSASIRKTITLDYCTCSCFFGVDVLVFADPTDRPTDWSRTYVTKEQTLDWPITKCLMVCAQKFTKHVCLNLFSQRREEKKTVNEISSKKKYTESSRFMDPLSSTRQHGMNLKTVAISLDLSLFIHIFLFVYSFAYTQHHTKYPIWIFDGRWKCVLG